MGLGNVIVLAQVTAYLLIFVLSFFVFIPLSVNKAQFGGHCLLYADGTWEDPANTTDFVLKNVAWGSTSSCNFVIFIGVISMPIAMFYIIWMSAYLYKDSDPSWLAAFLGFVCNLVVLVMVFATAMMLTLGFGMWCDLLTGAKGYLSSCENAQYTLKLEEKDVFAGNFYLEFNMSMFGLWTSWACWLVVAFMSGVKLYLYHRDEDFFISLSRERQRLIQRVQQPRHEVLA